MINKIFWDNDECLSHSSYMPFENQTYLTITLVDGCVYTILRPSAKEVLKYSRNLVGDDNVYMLTSASTDFAQAVNIEAGLGFNINQILTRDDMSKHAVSGAYGGSYVMPHGELAHEDNVLIDNLPSRYNIDKMSFIGINSSRYLQIRDYYGVNIPENERKFVNQVKEFLTLVNFI